MFNRAKKQALWEQEQEITRLRKREKEQEAQLLQVCAGIDAISSQSVLLLEGLKEEEQEQDNFLSHVVESMKEIYDSDLKQWEAVKRLLADGETLGEKRGADKERYERLFDRLQAWQDESAEEKEASSQALIEGQQVQMEQQKQLWQTMENLKKEMAQLENGLEKLTGLGHQMGVVSLHAAIEAGRMGEEGRKFVEAAEAVQVCAGSYQEETQAIVEQLAGMQERLSEAERQMDALNCQWKQREEALTGQREAVRSREVEWQELAEAFLTEEWMELLAEGHRVAGISEARRDCLGQVMRFMESAGVSFHKERQVLEQVREQLQQLGEVTQLHAGCEE